MTRQPSAIARARSTRRTTATVICDALIGVIVALIFLTIVGAFERCTVPAKMHADVHFERAR